MPALARKFEIVPAPSPGHRRVSLANKFAARDRTDSPLPLEGVTGRFDSPFEGGPRASIVSVTVPVAATDPVAFLETAGSQPRVFIEDPETGIVLAGYGVAHALVATGADRFWVVEVEARRVFEDAIHRVEDHAADTQGVGPRFIGGFAFYADPVMRAPWRAFPAAWFVLPSVMLTIAEGGSFLTLSATVNEESAAPAALARLQRQARTLRDARAPEPAPEGAAATWPPEHKADEVAWIERVESVLAAIRGHEAEKVVLARAIEAAAPQAFDALAALRRLATCAPGCSRYLVEPEAGHAFFGATPETLVSVTGRDARTAALASTVRAGASEAEAADLARALLASPKERREHDFVVRALRRGLERFSERVEADPQPEPARFGNVQHLRTRMSATLRETGLLFRALDALHPTPAVGGEPLTAALRLVRATEPVDRGWYAGLVGWFGPESDGTFLVAIRSAVVTPGRVVAYAGAGILSDSDPGREFQETSLKFKPMRDAIDPRA